MAALFDTESRPNSDVDSLLFRVPFRALGEGPVTFLTESADRFPDSYVLLFGVNQPVPQAEIDFGSTTLNVTRPLIPPLWPASHTSRLFSSTPASSLSNESSDMAEYDELDALQTKTSNPPRRSSMSASPIVLTTLNHESNHDEEWRRSAELTPRELLFRHHTTHDNESKSEIESDWIELPLTPNPGERRFPLPVIPFGEPWHGDDHPRQESPLLDSDPDDFVGRRILWGSQPRIFFRMHWDAMKSTADDPQDSLAALMIDIDKVFTSAEPNESGNRGLSKFIAEWDDIETGDIETAESHREEVVEQLKINPPFRAARSISLALDISAENSRRYSVHESVIVSADTHAPQRVAGPPKPVGDVPNPDVAGQNTSSPGQNPVAMDPSSGVTGQNPGATGQSQ